MNAPDQIQPALLRPKFGPCLSLYFSVSPHATHGDQVRVKSLAAQAVQMLEDWQPPLGKEHVFDLMRPLWRLLGTEGFWQDRRADRALFMAPGFFTELFLPHSVQDAVYVGSEFLIRPQLAPPSARSYFVLALHGDRARLFEGDGTGLRPSAFEMPTFDAVRNHEVTSEAEGTHANLTCDHCCARGDGDTEHARIKAYYHVIAGLLKAEYPNSRRPMILAGTSRNLAMFRAVARKLANINAYDLEVDPDSLPLAALARCAAKLAQPHLSRDWEETLRALHERKINVPVDREVASIVEEAIRGQIETLWIARGAQAWGTIGGGGVPNLHAIARPGDEDLLNLAAVYVLRHRGRVYEVEEGQLEPGCKAIAALRYLADRYQAATPTELANGGRS